MIWPRLQQVALAPVLAVQAAQVVRRTPRLPEAAGPREGVAGQGDPLHVLILGDSSAAGVGVDCQDAALSGHLVRAIGASYRVSWQLIARTGWTTGRLHRVLRQTRPRPFDIAVTALGVNDTTRLIGPARWRVQTAELHALLRTAFGVRRIYATTVPPLEHFRALPRPLNLVLGQHAARLRRTLEGEVATAPDLRLIAPDWGLDPAQMAADGFHPGPEIYRGWGQFAGQVILQDLRDRPL
ncbi:SGNH/GDSL hydrolase family protein [Roseobacter sinensis]|uniref:SGNH/GDSL hydrolase family protein n=1 Tax=Roseobacter sinensis TaxID=2931391 RepID=A0ABT3BBV2_9RHOB|nr:SGNH/GDSL hydrolase family protein [Roseobacter sp. WL0113]MCV3271056.1 SGNH/GDSL hydrolase family protein [Roseobacter sp. WL0113]